MTGQKRSGGGIKTCRIHDLLLDFCLRKANEENGLHLLIGKDDILPFEESHNLRRLCVHSKMEEFMESKLYCARLRSLSFFGENNCIEVTDISFIFRVFKLLRVLNMEKVRILSHDFFGGIGVLVQLRYLAITVAFDISPSVGNLLNLETPILHPVCGILVTMPATFWNMRKLRHLYLGDGEDEDDRRGLILAVDNIDNPRKFPELESLSGIHSENWSIMENQLRKFPNIRRLKCWLNEFEDDESNVMSFSFLAQLQSLTLSFDSLDVQSEFSFPPNIKKLHLSACCFSWERISTIAQLPNLEVLKLLDRCFIGEKWQMEEGDFSKLRFLKLAGLDLVNWTGCDDQFPNLEKLVVEDCRILEEIPECLESVDTLEMIEVINCSDRVAGLFQTVADYLKDRGNSVLQVHVGSGSADDEDEGEDNNSTDNEDNDSTDDSADDEDDDSTDDFADDEYA